MKWQVHGIDPSLHKVTIDEGYIFPTKILMLVWQLLWAYGCEFSAIGVPKTCMIIGELNANGWICYWSLGHNVAAYLFVSMIINLLLQDHLILPKAITILNNSFLGSAIIIA